LTVNRRNELMKHSENKNKYSKNSSNYHPNLILASCTTVRTRSFFSSNGVKPSTMLLVQRPSAHHLSLNWHMSCRGLDMVGFCEVFQHERLQYPFLCDASVNHVREKIHLSPRTYTSYALDKTRNASSMHHMILKDGIKMIQSCENGAGPFADPESLHSRSASERIHVPRSLLCTRARRASIRPGNSHGAPQWLRWTRARPRISERPLTW